MPILAPVTDKTDAAAEFLGNVIADITGMDRDACIEHAKMHGDDPLAFFGSPDKAQEYIEFTEKYDYDKYAYAQRKRIKEQQRKRLRGGK